jgi:hypothetical protein
MLQSSENERSRKTYLYSQKQEVMNITKINKIILQIYSTQK